MKEISDKTAVRIAKLCNDAAMKANEQKKLSAIAWDAINKVMHREIDAMEDFGADEFVGVIEYGETITPNEVKRIISTLSENRESSSGMVRK